MAMTAHISSLLPWMLHPLLQPVTWYSLLLSSSSMASRIFLNVYVCVSCLVCEITNLIQCLLFLDWTTATTTIEIFFSTSLSLFSLGSLRHTHNSSPGNVLMKNWSKHNVSYYFTGWQLHKHKTTWLDLILLYIPSTLSLPFSPLFCLQDTPFLLVFPSRKLRREVWRKFVARSKIRSQHKSPEGRKKNMWV